MKKLLLASVLILTSCLAYAQQKQSRAKVVCGPYVQCVSETGFTVIWTTDIDAVGWVEIAPDDDTHFYNAERPKYYDSRGNGVFPIGKIHKDHNHAGEKHSGLALCCRSQDICFR